MEDAGADDDGLVLVYDGTCGFCVATSAWLVGRGVVDEAHRRPFQAFEGATADRLRAAGIRNEIAVLDPRTGEVRTGLPGLLWVAAPGPLGGLARFVDRAPLRRLATVGYRALSYNRRILAPVPPAVAEACDCEPDPHAGYRALFVALLAAFAALAFAAFGAAAGAWSGGAGGAAVALLLLAVGWGLPAGLGFLTGAERGGRLAAHLAWTAAVAAVALLVALPVLALLRLVLPPGAHDAVTVGAAFFAVFLAVRAALRRASVLAASPVLVLAWAVFLAAAAAVSFARLDR